MGFNTETQKSPAAIHLNTILDLMHSGKYAAALLVLKDIVKNGTDSPVFIPVNFNLALCYIKTDDYKGGLPYLEKALALVRTIRNRQQHPAGRNDDYKNLRAKEIAEASYLKPMPEEYPSLFTKNAEEDITLTLIEAYEQCGLGEKTASLATTLGPEFNAWRKARAP